MSTQEPEYTEEELRAIEAEMQRISVDDVLLQTIVTLLNLGARKAGLGAAAGTPAPEQDLAQVHQAIEGTRALLPLIEARHDEQVGPIRDALARLQMHYAQRTGAQAAEPQQPPAPGGPAEPEGPGPAQRTGRLWVPGQ
ncbi:MAG TPA: hypothetical protein VES79_04345 [Solirubrobacteraceae bacterium]|nr:hypothetical protein [Solirubrobacteraceae bacterium]